MSGPSLLKQLNRRLGLSHLEFPIPEHGRKPIYTFGGVVFSGFLIMVATGFILTQIYHPLPQQAYQSLERIQRIGWASYLRALHYWTAQGVIAAILLHTARVFITGAYKYPRQVTWWIGVALLATLLMGSYFSGTVLKWDQEGSDALIHYQETLRQLGPLGAPLTESLPGSSPMNLRIYMSHITIFPIIFILLVAIHFYFIHIFNLSPTPSGRWSNATEVPPEELRGQFSEHARSIAIFSLIYYGVLAGVAFFVRAPLLEAPSDHGTAVKPPWPFLWMYGLENVWGIGVILYASLALFGLLFLVPLLDRKQERRWGARKGILILGGAVALSLASLTLYGWLAPAQEHEHGHTEEEGVDHQPAPHEEEDRPHSDERRPQPDHQD